MRYFPCAALAAVIIVLASCASVPVESEIPENLSVAELIQEAQNCVDKGAYKAAEVYFSTILHRFDDPAAIVAAEYEMAHIKIKQKKWQEAAPMVAALLQKYEDDLYYQLPRSYLKLAELDKQKIPKKYLEQADESKEGTE